MKTKQQKGSALLEVLIVIMIGLIVLSAAGTVVFSGQTSWNKGWSKANLQRDGSYVMNNLARSIRGGSSANVEADGKAIKIYNGKPWTRLSAESTSLTRETDLEAPQKVIEYKSEVEDVQFNVVGNKVEIRLTMKDGNLQMHFASTVMMRNYGE